MMMSDFSTPIFHQVFKELYLKIHSEDIDFAYEIDFLPEEGKYQLIAGLLRRFAVLILTDFDHIFDDLAFQEPEVDGKGQKIFEDRDVLNEYYLKKNITSFLDYIPIDWSYNKAYLYFEELNQRDFLETSNQDGTVKNDKMSYEKYNFFGNKGNELKRIMSPHDNIFEILALAKFKYAPVITKLAVKLKEKFGEDYLSFMNIDGKINNPKNPLAISFHDNNAFLFSVLIKEFNLDPSPFLNDAKRLGGNEHRTRRMMKALVDAEQLHIIRQEQAALQAYNSNKANKMIL